MASCAAVAFAYVQVGERAPLLNSGGFLLLSIAACGLIVAASHPGSSFGRLLGRQPLRWVGERSYGLFAISIDGRDRRRIASGTFAGMVPTQDRRAIFFRRMRDARTKTLEPR